MGCFNKTTGGTFAHKTEKVDIGNDVYVFVRELGARDWLELQAKYPEDSTAKVYDVVCDMLARCIVDDAGKPLFTDGDDLKANFPVGLSTVWALRDKVDEMSAPKKN